MNDVLCFPFIFCGALDVGAGEVDEVMKLANTEAIAGIARKTADASVGQVYVGGNLSCGADLVIPKWFDPRLLPVIAHAAIESGVATEYLDLDACREGLRGLVIRSSLVMWPIYASARATQRRIVFVEGEDKRVLRATQAISKEIGDVMTLIGRSTGREMLREVVKPERRCGQRI